MRQDDQVSVEVMYASSELSMKPHLCLPNLCLRCSAATLNKINLTRVGRKALAAQGVMAEHQGAWASWTDSSEAEAEAEAEAEGEDEAMLLCEHTGTWVWSDASASWAWEVVGGVMASVMDAGKEARE